jgi:hypothetical protein
MPHVRLRDDESIELKSLTSQRSQRSSLAARGSAATAALVVALTFAGCSAPDPRLATPQDTVATLLAATHLAGVTSGILSDAAPDRPPPDFDVVARCFWDIDRDDPASRAMADFTAGMLAARQRDLVYRIGRRHAVVQSGFRDVHLRRVREGWVIVLRDTVPEEIREGLRRGPRQRAGLRAPDEVL